MPAVPAFGSLRAPAHWRTVDFISDLHLGPEEPRTFDAWARYLGRTRADAVVMLGDVFEAWVGDDSREQPFERSLVDAIKAATSRRTVAFMHGNRDFLIGAGYAARCGMSLLDEPLVIDLYGTPTVILHGDLLCTDDLAYQQFRAQTRDARWQSQFLSQPLQARLAFAAQARAASKARYGELISAGTAEIVGDVAKDAVDALFATAGVRRMIHGHTHRPAIHDEGHGNTRIVLGDWYEQGSVLRVSESGLDLASL